MKLIFCFCFINLFSCLICSRSPTLKCGSSSCQDVKISEAKVLIKYDKEGQFPVKKGESVEVYGRGENNWYIKNGDQFGFIPKSFLKEQKVVVRQENLVPVDVETILNPHPKKSNILSPTPPLMSNLVDGSLSEPVPTENTEEISHSQRYEMIDGTKIPIDDGPPSGSDLQSPKLPTDVNSKSQASGENEKTVPESSDPTQTKVESTLNNETESPKSEPKEVPPRPVGESESIKSSQTPADIESVSVEDDEQTDPGEEEEEEEEEEDDEDETESKEEPGFLAKLGETLESIAKGITEELDKTEGTATAPEEESKPEKEIESSDIDNFVVPSTTDAIAAGDVETPFYQPSQTILASKTMESILEATAQPALSENADTHKTVESAVTPTDDNLLSQQDQAAPVVQDSSPVESSGTEIASANGNTSDLALNDNIAKSVQSATPISPPQELEDSFVEGNTSNDSAPNSTIPADLEDKIASLKESETESVSSDVNIATTDNVQSNGSAVPSDLQKTVPDSVSLSETDAISEDSPKQPEIVEPSDLQKTVPDSVSLNKTDAISEDSPKQPEIIEPIQSAAEEKMEESGEIVENTVNSTQPLEKDKNENQINFTESSENVESKVNLTESLETDEKYMNLPESFTNETDSHITPADGGQVATPPDVVTPPIEETATTPPPEKVNDSIPIDSSASVIETKSEKQEEAKDEINLSLPVVVDQAMNNASEEFNTSTVSESFDVNKKESQSEGASYGIYDSLMHRNNEAEKVNNFDDPSVTASDNLSRLENNIVLDEKMTPAAPVEAVKSEKEADPISEATVADPIGYGEVEAEAPPNVEDFWASLKSFGALEKALEMGYDSLSSIKESSIFGYLVKKNEDSMQSVLHDGRIETANYHFDESCKLEDRNCQSMKPEGKLPPPQTDAVPKPEGKLPPPQMDSFEIVSEEGILSLVLDPLLSSTCMRAQSLLVFLTTAITLIFSAFCYFYFDKRSKDASFYKRIDILEKQLFITKKEALEFENKCSSLSSYVGTPVVDPSLLSLNAAQITELEAQRNELSEKVDLLANELSITISMNKDLEKRLQEVLSSTQNTEMIFKTVDQLQQRIEMQQKASLELNSQLKNKDKVIEEFEESLQKSIAYGNQLEELIAALKKENEKLSIESSEKIIHLNSELDQAKSEKTLEATKLKAEIDSLKLSLEQARSSLDIAEANIVELKTIISDDAKNSDGLGDVFNGSELKAKLAVSELNIDKLKDRLQEESGARQFLEDHVASITEALNQLKASYGELEKEKREAENAVKVLKDYFRKQEEELKKEIEEKSAFQLQKDEETLFIKMKQLEEEKGSLKAQIEEMKKEIVEQENLFKRDRVQLEKKADDNWLLSRQINRKLQDSKQEAAILRSRLTAVEKMLTEKNEHDANENDQSMTNGEGIQQAPNVSSPSMLLNFPNTANSSFAKYNSSDLILPPPLGLPGNEFIPPPPIYHPDLRLPPLGSVGRIPSPPRGMSPPLSLETNFGLNFSPPPPMPPQYYYYHRSDSPSDYDSSSYSRGDKYRGDSPSNVERSGSSKNKTDPSRKLSADQPDSYPSSNPSHPPPLKPVARNPTASGQKGWSTAGQSSKSVEKNSRNSGR